LTPGGRVGIDVASGDIDGRATRPGGEPAAVSFPAGISDTTATALLSACGRPTLIPRLARVRACGHARAALGAATLSGPDMV